MFELLLIWLYPPKFCLFIYGVAHETQRSVKHIAFNERT